MTGTTEPKFTKEEKQILISILEQVSIQGIESMKHVVSISNKLKKSLGNGVEKDNTWQISQMVTQP
ncbi:hypothetical protein LCGC14_2468040 [marine sediment metagenome]|uniref:Uncharacterized protein n=1 Tax=marine sediment metagenome TaxID=412755 RepID=A0A0F9DNA8_9ZZZZ